MPLESEKRIHDIWHNTSVYLRTCTCTIVYTHTQTYSYTNERVNNTAQIYNDGQLETANIRPQNRLTSIKVLISNLFDQIVLFSRQNVDDTCTTLKVTF